MLGWGEREEHREQILQKIRHTGLVKFVRETLREKEKLGEV